MTIWMQEIWNFVWTFMKKIQIKQKKQADKHWWKMDFSVENEVWISMKNWKIDWFSKKLDSQTADFYRIIKKIKYSYWIDFSDSIKMHSVFSSDKLWKTARNSLTEQIVNFVLSIEISKHNKYEVKQILTFVIHYWKLQYRIKWISYDDDFK